MPGPPPDPKARRRRAQSDWRILTPDAAVGLDIPEWPLSKRITAAQKRRWDALWTLPQSVIWRENDSTHAVARYTTLVIEVEKPMAAVTLHSHIARLEEQLGLTPMGMRRLFLQIDTSGVAGQSGEPGQSEGAEGIDTPWNVTELFGNGAGAG